MFPLKNRHVFSTVLALLLITSVSYTQTTIVLTPDRDAALGYHDNYNTSNNNYGTAIQGATFCIPGASGGYNKNRAVIHFDLSTIPANATVISATMNLYATGPLGTLQGHTGTNNSAYLQRITSSWTEMGVTWNTQPTYTTTNQVTLPASTSSTQDYLNINVLALVQDMINNPGSSDGFLLQLVNDVNTNALLFYSRDCGIPAKVPQLSITYMVCGGTFVLDPNKDASLGYHDNYNTANNNYGTAIQDAAYDIPGASGGHNKNRALISFDVSTLPVNATLVSASLDLHATGPLGVLQGHTGNANAAYLQRVTSAWTEMGVTWNTQPTFTTTNQVTLPQSTSPTQDYLNINVTSLVQDMISNPSGSDGFLLQEVVESLTNALLFYSRDCGDSTKFPRLTVVMQCNVKGIEEAEANGFSAIAVAPNPSNGQFQMTWKNDPAQLDIRVYDVTGRQVYVSRENLLKNGTLEMDLRQLSAGLYHLVVSDEQRRYGLPIVIGQ